MNIYVSPRIAEMKKAAIGVRSDDGSYSTQPTNQGVPISLKKEKQIS